MDSCQRTKEYVAKRTSEGKSKREIMRCLKRYAAREIQRRITNPQEGAAAVERHTEAILDGPPAAAIREAHRLWTGMLDTADYSGGQGLRKLIARFHFPHICDQRMADVPRIHEIPAHILLTQINSK